MREDTLNVSWREGETGQPKAPLEGRTGLWLQLTKAFVERALQAEMAVHLGHGKNEPIVNAVGNSRNGKSRKTLKGEFGELPVETPGDSYGSFEPQLIQKHQTHWPALAGQI